MADKKEIYADGIGQIHFAGNMVRYDFGYKWDFFRFLKKITQKRKKKF